MKASIVILLLFAVCTVETVAQWRFYVSAGPDLTTFTGGDKKDWGGTDTNPKWVIRGHLGGLAERVLDEKWVAGAGFFLAIKGTAYAGDVEYYDIPSNSFGTIEVKYSKVLTYIDLPVYAKYLVSEKFHLVGGLQPSILISAKVKNDDNARKAYPGLPATENAQDSYTGFDVAVFIGPRYLISERLAIELLLKPGILKIAKGESYDGQGGMGETKYKVHNMGVGLSVVYLVRASE